MTRQTDMHVKQTHVKRKKESFHTIKTLNKLTQKIKKLYLTSIIAEHNFGLLSINSTSVEIEDVFQSSLLNYLSNKQINTILILTAIINNTYTLFGKSSFNPYNSRDHLLKMTELRIL